MPFMKHPDLPDNKPVPVLQETFDRVWADRGWELAEEDETSETSTDSEPVKEKTPKKKG